MIGSTAAFLLFLLGGQGRGFPLDRPQVSCEGQVRRYDHFLSRSHLDDLINWQIQFRQNQVNLFWQKCICFTFKFTEYETHEMSSSHSPTLRTIRTSLGSARSRTCTESVSDGSRSPVHQTQSETDRKSDSRTAQCIQAAFKIKHPVLTWQQRQKY